MNEAVSTPAAPKQAGTWPMFRAVVGIGILCGLAIVVVYEVTGPIIQKNRISLLERSIIEVLPGATTSAAFKPTDNGSFEKVPSESEGDDIVYAGYADDGSLLGLAIVGKGMGYQDYVRILYGYSFEKQSILGISVLESRETPGLGDRIESDPNFLANFGTLDVSIAPDGKAVAHRIEFVKPGEKSEQWQIDGISGATITSKATADMLSESSAKWMPLVHPRKADFQKQKGEG